MVFTFCHAMQVLGVKKMFKYTVFYGNPFSMGIIAQGWSA